MIGRSGRQSRPPLETRKAKHLAKAAFEAERRLLLTMLKAEAHPARAAALAHLADDYARKIADARSRLSGPELLAALSAIRSEHMAAERAMNVKLSGEARQRERQVLGALKANRKRKAKDFEAAAGGAGAPASGRRRPRQRRKRDVKGGPRPRR